MILEIPDWLSKGVSANGNFFLRPPVSADLSPFVYESKSCRRSNDRRVPLQDKALRKIRRGILARPFDVSEVYVSDLETDRAGCRILLGAMPAAALDKPARQDGDRAAHRGCGEAEERTNQHLS
jgi:hypothetical protein